MNKGNSIAGSTGMHYPGRCNRLDRIELGPELALDFGPASAAERRSGHPHRRVHRGWRSGHIAAGPGRGRSPGYDHRARNRFYRLRAISRSRPPARVCRGSRDRSKSARSEVQSTTSRLGSLPTGNIFDQAIQPVEADLARNENNSNDHKRRGGAEPDPHQPAGLPATGDGLAQHRHQHQIAWRCPMKEGVAPQAPLW